METAEGNDKIKEELNSSSVGLVDTFKDSDRRVYYEFYHEEGTERDTRSVLITDELGGLLEYQLRLDPPKMVDDYEFIKDTLEEVVGATVISQDINTYIRPRTKKPHVIYESHRNGYVDEDMSIIRIMDKIAERYKERMEVNNDA